MLSRLTWIAIFSVATLAASAQNRTITGTVVDTENNPVPGASVILGGTTRGTAALGDGTFSLTNVPASGTLVVNVVGYTEVSIPLTAASSYRIVLSEDTQFLDEVVVVGYGVMRKSDVTGAMVSVSAEQLHDRPVMDPFQALQGKAAGVDITNAVRPGEIGNIRIRGARSISGGNSPLYVVDGIPLQGDTNLSSINTWDIESIEILKDASATAIYGSRAANGVVLVTTNKGEAGRYSIDYNGSISIETMVDGAERFTAGEYIDYSRWANYYAGGYPRADEPNINQDLLMFGSEDFAFENLLNGWSNGAAWNQARKDGAPLPDGGTWDGSKVPTTDWFGMVSRTGISHNHNLSVSGGTERMTSHASFGYMKQQGTSYGQSMERYTLNVSSVFKPNSWFQLSASLRPTWSIQEYGQDNTGQGAQRTSSIFASAAMQFPYAVPYNDKGERILTPGGVDKIRNVADEWEHTQNRRELFGITSSLEATVQLPLEGLSYQFRTGPSYRQRRNGVYVSPLSATRQDPFDIANLENNRQFTWNVENQINYIRTFDKHNLNVTLVQSAEKFQRVEDNIDSSHLPLASALWNNMGTVDRQYITVGSNLVERQSVGYLGRVNYTFDDRFILTGSVRIDGSSVLATGHKWGTFYAGAFAWRLEQEEFIKRISWIQQLKLRLSYGETGQQGGIDPYSSISALASGLFPYGSSTDRFYYIHLFNLRDQDALYANPELGWETTRTFNVGLDFSLFRSRVSGSLEYYHSITSGLLLPAELLRQTGYARTTGNLGKSQNNGFEIGLQTINVRTGDFEWDSNLNLAWTKNKILELADGKVDDLANNRFIGHPIGVFYDYQFGGIWKEEDAVEMQRFNESHTLEDGTVVAGQNFQVGQVRPVDQNGDYIIDADHDRVIIGSENPTWSVGFRNTFTYRGVELGIMMNGRFGYWDNDGNQPLGAVGGIRKIDYYNENNKNAAFRRPEKTTDGHDEDPFNAIQQYYKASFLNVSNISLGYVFPRNLVQKWGIQNLRVYAQVYNPFAVYRAVKWKNMEWNSEYWSRNYVFGINVAF